jgi:hypothetical protein
MEHTYLLSFEAQSDEQAALFSRALGAFSGLRNFEIDIQAELDEADTAFEELGVGRFARLLYAAVRTNERSFQQVRIDGQRIVLEFYDYSIPEAVCKCLFPIVHQAGATNISCVGPSVSGDEEIWTFRNGRVKGQINRSRGNGTPRKYRTTPTDTLIEKATMLLEHAREKARNVDHLQRSSFTNRGILMLEEAQHRGSTEADYLLAICFEDGLFFEENLEEAKRLYERAARTGHLEAMWRLAYLRDKQSEDDCVVSPTEAYVWLLFAVRHGHPDAIMARERLEDHLRALSDAQRSEAEALIADVEILLESPTSDE